MSQVTRLRPTVIVIYMICALMCVPTKLLYSSVHHVIKYSSSFPTPAATREE